MSKPTAFGLFQLVWHFLKRFGIFTSGLAFFVHLDLATLLKTVITMRRDFHDLIAQQFSTIFSAGCYFSDYTK